MVILQMSFEKNKSWVLTSSWPASHGIPQGLASVFIFAIVHCNELLVWLLKYCVFGSVQWCGHSAALPVDCG